jgi:amino acid permease
MIFGTISQSLVSSLFYDDLADNFMTNQKTLYVLVLGTLLFPVFMQKELKELKIVSIVLFIGVIFFIIIFGI